jgi:hypothetical protein
MAANVVTALVFKDDVRHPVEIESAYELRDGGARAAATLVESPARVFTLQPSGSQPVHVNGRGVPDRNLRDGDEIVVGDTVCVFRQALAVSDLEHYDEWSTVHASIRVDFVSSVRPTWLRLLSACGLPGTPSTEFLVEDWRSVQIVGPHFGFGRRRSLWMDEACTWGLDQMQWDVVGSGQPSFVLQRLTSVGLHGLVLKWQLRRRSRDAADPFMHESLLIGCADRSQHDLAQDALRVPFGRDLRLERASDEAIWSLHHTDRILALPGVDRYADYGIYSTISRL